MSYTPKSEEQLALEGLLPEGDYDYEVVETSDKPSKSGNFMITLKLNVFDAEGGSRVLTDYIVPNSNYGERKLRHAADASNIIDIYDSGALVHTDFLNRTGKLKLKIQDGTAEYPMPKNSVFDYIKREDVGTTSIAKESIATGAMTKNDLNDEIPF